MKKIYRVIKLIQKGKDFELFGNFDNSVSMFIDDFELEHYDVEKLIKILIGGQYEKEKI